MPTEVNEYNELLDRLLSFVGERDWSQFHSPKNLAMALTGEVGELVEHFQWLDTAAAESLDADTLREVCRELADVQIYAMLLADRLGIDLMEAVSDKIENRREACVIVELKQWEKVESTGKDAVVRTFLGGAHRETTHPSRPETMMSTRLEVCGMRYSTAIPASRTRATRSGLPAARFGTPAAVHPPARPPTPHRLENEDTRTSRLMTHRRANCECLGSSRVL